MVGGYELYTQPGTAIAPLNTFGKASARADVPLNDIDANLFRNTLATQLMQADTPYGRIYNSKADLSDALAEIDTDKLVRIDRTARAMEGLLLETLLKQMWATLPESELFGNGLDTKFYREMWLEEIASDVSSNGAGVGIAATVAWEMILRAQTESAVKLEGSSIPGLP